MKLYLIDECQVSFPGSKICGVLCVKKLSNVSHKPTISAKGFTRIWKSGTNKETDEYSLFFEDTAKISSETDNTLYSTLINKLTAVIDYSKIFCFHIVLPNNLPPSHEVPFGHTRYKLKANFNNKKCSKYFSVNQWVDLEKRNDTIEKRAIFSVSLFNFCQPIEITLNLNQSYYLPGETIYVGAMINNNSWQDVILSKVFIIQTTRYWKSLHLLPLKHVRIISEGTRGYIASGASQIWCKHPLYIPAVIPTTNTSNNLFNFFDVKYKIKIVVTLKSSKKIIALKQQIFIGNKVNVIPYEIMSKSCSIIELEGNDFIPKYVIYETNQE